MAVDKGDDVRMLEAFENVDFGGKVIFQLLIKLRQVDRLDRNESLGTLVK